MSPEKRESVSPSVLPTRLLCPWDSPGKNTGKDSHSLLQGIFPTKGLNQLSCTAGRFFYHLSHQGSPYLIYKLRCVYIIYIPYNFKSLWRVATTWNRGKSAHLNQIQPGESDPANHTTVVSPKEDLQSQEAVIKAPDWTVFRGSPHALRNQPASIDTAWNIAWERMG